MIKTLARTTALTGYLLVSSLAFADEGLDKLLDMTIEAYGGKTLVMQTRAFKQTGSTTSRARNSSGPIFRAYEYPDKLRMETHYRNGTEELRILNGDRAFKEGKPALGPIRYAMQLQLVRMNLPRHILEHRSEIRDLGPVAGANTDPQRQIEVPVEGKLKIVAHIDPKTGRITKTIGQGTVEGINLEFITTYDDFRNVAGRLVAFKEGHYAMGSSVGSTELDSVEFMDAWDTPIFEPPL